MRESRIAALLICLAIALCCATRQRSLLPERPCFASIRRPTPTRAASCSGACSPVTTRGYSHSAAAGLGRSRALVDLLLACSDDEFGRVLHAADSRSGDCLCRSRAGARSPLPVPFLAATRVAWRDLLQPVSLALAGLLALPVAAPLDRAPVTLVVATLATTPSKGRSGRPSMQGVPRSRGRREHNQRQLERGTPVRCTTGSRGRPHERVFAALVIRGVRVIATNRAKLRTSYLRSRGARPSTGAGRRRGGVEHRGVRRLSYVPALDGLRGAGVVTVIAVHYFGYPTGGAFSMEMFFALSGFLITTLLLEERDRTGVISLTAFYRRRAYRLLPALFAVLAAYLVVMSASPGRALEQVTRRVLLRDEHRHGVRLSPDGRRPLRHRSGRR